MRYIYELIFLLLIYYSIKFNRVITNKQFLLYVSNLQVLALESIYGDNVSVLDGKGGLRLLQVLL